MPKMMSSPLAQMIDPSTIGTIKAVQTGNPLKVMEAPLTNLEIPIKAFQTATTPPTPTIASTVNPTVVGAQPSSAIQSLQRAAKIQMPGQTIQQNQTIANASGASYG